MKKTRLSRFEERVQPEPNSGCHLWSGAMRARGDYGKVRWGGKDFSAHRISWELYVGPVPDGLCVLHKCDTPACVNPAHLFLGTQADNVRDMISKGRDYDKSGHGNPRAKLTPQQVMEIRGMPRRNQAEIGQVYGIAQSSVSRIQRGKVY